MLLYKLKNQKKNLINFIKKKLKRSSIKKTLNKSIKL